MTKFKEHSVLKLSTFPIAKLSSFSIFLIRTEFEYLHHKSSAHFMKGETSSITFKHCDYTNVSPCLLLEFFLPSDKNKKSENTKWGPNYRSCTSKENTKVYSMLQLHQHIFVLLSDDFPRIAVPLQYTSHY